MNLNIAIWPQQKQYAAKPSCEKKIRSTSCIDLLENRNTKNMKSKANKYNFVMSSYCALFII